MILNVTTATENCRWYRNRYESMITSIDHGERCNAEACKLGARAYQQIVVLLKTPFDQDHPIEFDAEIQAIIDRTRKEWNDYCQTGISPIEFNPPPEPMHYNVVRYQNEQRARDLKIAVESAKKKGKPGDDPAPPVSDPIPEIKIDHEVVGFIDPTSIYEVINNIMYEWREEVDYCQRVPMGA